MGCALALNHEKEAKDEFISDVIGRLEQLNVEELNEAQGLEPLFANEEELATFRARHNKAKACLLYTSKSVHRNIFPFFAKLSDLVFVSGNAFQPT